MRVFINIILGIGLIALGWIGHSQYLGPRTKPQVLDYPVYQCPYIPKGCTKRSDWAVIERDYKKVQTEALGRLM